MPNMTYLALRKAKWQPCFSFYFISFYFFIFLAGRAYATGLRLYVVCCLSVTLCTKWAIKNRPLYYCV